MKKIHEIHDCYGCGVCATVCVKQCIKIDLNDRGFYNPVVDQIKCSNCGLCMEVCAFAHDNLPKINSVIKGYGAWSNDPGSRFKCSSGGVGFELGRYLISEGYKVCAVKYNVANHRAEHYIAENEDELALSIGSKYIQSYTVDGFKAINRKGKYLVTGTPCQIDSFRRYIRRFNVEDNFVLMDFFCHSVPSMLAWNKYLQIVEMKIGKVVHASWRNKNTGWHDSWAMALNNNEYTEIDKSQINSKNLERNVYNSRRSEGDVFYELFLGDYCCNPACQKNCKYKYDKSSADIRIGDFWGKTYQNNEDGVSAVVAFTDKGAEIIQKTDCTLIEHPFEIVAEGQMKKNVRKAYTSSIMYHLLASKRITSIKLIKFLTYIEWFLHLPEKVVRRLI